MWHENYPADEIPPEWMWPFNKELDDWFEEVELERERKRDPNYEPHSDVHDTSGLVMNEA